LTAADIAAKGIERRTVRIRPVGDDVEAQVA
jgi:hypothetical protein